MSAPPGNARTPHVHHPLATETEGSGRENSAYLSVRTLTRQAHHVAAGLGVSVSPSRVSRLVKRFVHEGRGDIDFHTWFISYADPTGETAVRNVMKGNQ